MIPKSEISIHFYSVSYFETLNTNFYDMCENIPLGHSKDIYIYMVFFFFGVHSEFCF